MSFGTTYTSGSVITLFSAYAPMIQMNWRAEDLPITSTAAKTASPTSANLATPLESGFSAGSKAAIGIAIPFLIFAIAGTIALIMFRRRKQRRSSQLDNHGTEPATKKQRDSRNMERRDLFASEILNEVSTEGLNESGGAERHELPVQAPSRNRIALI